MTIGLMYDHHFLAKLYYSKAITMVVVHISTMRINKKNYTVLFQTPGINSGSSSLHGGGPDRAEPIKALTLTRTVTKAKIGSRG
jgi:hypothetical protein